eukprot:s5329_g3.t1
MPCPTPTASPTSLAPGLSMEPSSPSHAAEGETACAVETKDVEGQGVSVVWLQERLSELEEQVMLARQDRGDAELRSSRLSEQLDHLWQDDLDNEKRERQVQANEERLLRIAEVAELRNAVQRLNKARATRLDPDLEGPPDFSVLATCLEEEEVEAADAAARSLDLVAARKQNLTQELLGIVEATEKLSKGISDFPQAGEAISVATSVANRSAALEEGASKARTVAALLRSAELDFEESLNRSTEATARLANAGHDAQSQLLQALKVVASGLRLAKASGAKVELSGLLELFGKGTLGVAGQDLAPSPDRTA